MTNLLLVCFDYDCQLYDVEEMEVRYGKFRKDLLKDPTNHSVTFHREGVIVVNRDDPCFYVDMDKMDHINVTVTIVSGRLILDIIPDDELDENLSFIPTLDHIQCAFQNNITFYKIFK